MRLVHTDQTFSAGDKFRYFPISDIHVGPDECDEGRLRELIQEIRNDPSALWSHGGDAGDLITPKDPRFEGRGINARYPANRIPDATIEHCVELFAPIADKCLFWGIGNHEFTIHKHYDRGIGAETAARLGIPERYIGYRGFCGIRFRYDKGSTSSTLWIDYHHGWQGGRLYGAQLVEAERVLGHSPANIIVRGHSHKRSAQVFQWMVPSDKTIRFEKRVVAITGTFARSMQIHKGVDPDRLSLVEDDTWADRKGFRPQDPLGPPEIVIIPKKRSDAGDAAFDFKVVL